MLFEGILLIVIGIGFTIIGILNRKGNISMLHFYHIKRVEEKDRIPLGKKVGLGMFFISFPMIISGILSIFNYYFDKDIYTLIGTGIMLVGLSIGLVITLLAINKYNKGIF